MPQRIRAQTRKAQPRRRPRALLTMLAVALLRMVPLLPMTTVAHAQSAAGAAKEFDLLGTWAVECTQAPSPTNEHASFSLAPFDTMWVLNDFGPDYENMVYRVIEARPVAPDKLSLRQVLASDEAVVLDVVLVKDSARIRVWSSRTAQGNTLVREGKVAATSDQSTRWVNRCGERWAGRPDTAVAPRRD